MRLYHSQVDTSVSVSVHHNRELSSASHFSDFQDIDLGLELILSDYIQTIDRLALYHMATLYSENNSRSS